MENNYDIKYAIAVLNNPGKLSFYPYDEKSMVGYVVSKVFVVSEETKYKDGEEYKVYDVVLPYENIGNERFMPLFNKHGNAVNTTRIYRVYDSYESAKEECDELNSKLKFKAVAEAYSAPYGTYNERVERAQKKFRANMNECNTFETIINERSKDLEVKSNKALKLLV